MRYLFLIVTLFIINCRLNARYSDSTYVYVDNDSAFNRYYRAFAYSETRNKKWATSNKTITYENQGLSHSAYLALNEDSTFIFFLVYEIGYCLSTGEWTIENKDRLTLLWNRARTLAYCKDKSIYTKYFEYRTPTALPIDSWKFIIKKKKLNPLDPE